MITHPNIDDIPEPAEPAAPPDALDALRAKLAEHLPAAAMPDVETALAAAVRQATGEALIHIIRSLKPARGPVPHELLFLEAALGLDPIDGEDGDPAKAVTRQRWDTKVKGLQGRIEKPVADAL